MKTTTYNPSPLEVEFANIISELKETIEQKLSNTDIVEIDNHSGDDNPLLRFHLIDQDGDPHEVVIKIIQKPDNF